MSQSCPAQTFVAQVSNLPYRGFPIRRRRETPVSHGSPALSRLEVGDTADWKSALQPGETDHYYNYQLPLASGANALILARISKIELNYYEFNSYSRRDYGSGRADWLFVAFSYCFRFDVRAQPSGHPAFD